MRIRTRVAVIVLGTMVAAVAATSVVTTRVLLTGFESLETADAEADAQRAVRTIEAQLETLAFKSVDWAMWDDAYAFVADPSEDHQWVQSNIVDETFESLEIELFLVADLEGRVILERANDYEGTNPDGVPDELVSALASGPLAAVGEQRSERRGLLRAGDGALLVAAHEITDSTGASPPRGVLVMARWLDQPLISQWASRTDLDIEVSVLPPGLADRDADVTRREGQVIATATYDDVAGNPLVQIAVRQPRDIVDTGRFSLAIFLVVMIGTLGAATLILTPMLDRMLLRRLRRLTDETTGVGASGHVHERVAVEGSDEVTALATSINSMLASLERAQQEQQLRNVELVEALEGKDRFVSTVAHELRTPITALKGLALTLLRAEGRLDADKQRELLGRIAERTDSMQALVEELLTMSRLAAGKISATPEPVALGRLVGGLLDDLATVTADVHAEVPDDVFVTADPDHVTRILINLLENARRYGAPPFEISARGGPDEVVLAVADHGRGISEEHAERLFQSFEQLEDTSSEGLGLGLSIVRSLAELNGGGVRCVETPGGGATFEVRLPAASLEDFVLHQHITGSSVENASSRH